MANNLPIFPYYHDDRAVEEIPNMCVSVHPMIKVTNQLVAAPTGSNVHIQCYVETSPKAMHSWAKIDGKSMIYE